jgi:hypothetical protein
MIVFFRALSEFGCLDGCLDGWMDGWAIGCGFGVGEKVIMLRF